ncbi:MAG: hypothetical protein M3N29_01445 [Chloroflexota bacterium]|nr:hypothetical protein [Chloroflexota bacterium]
MAIGLSEPRLDELAGTDDVGVGRRFAGSNGARGGDVGPLREVGLDDRPLFERAGGRAGGVELNYERPAPPTRAREGEDYEDQLGAIDRHAQADDDEREPGKLLDRYSFGSIA